MIPALIALSVVVGLIVIAVVVFVVLDFKGEKIAASRAKKSAAKQAAKREKEREKFRPAKEASKKPAVKKEELREPVAKEEAQKAQEPPVAIEATEEPEEEREFPEPVREEPSYPIAAAITAGADDDELTEVRAITDHGKTRYIIIKYSKSFLAKLIQSDDETKQYYSAVKNELLSYKGVKSRVSWRWETFRSGRVILARLRLRGKSLSLALPLNAAEYEDSKYIVEDFSSVKSFADTPCIYRIKNDRRLKYSAELIERVMSERGLSKDEGAAQVDYAGQYPYESTQALLARKLIRELTDEEAQSGTVFPTRKSVTVAEADTLIGDDVAQTLVQRAESVDGGGRKPDRTKVDIINIDTLSQYFADGEVVTLEEIKKRVKEVNRRTTYIKVLARGTLDKSLTVYADSFSLQAVKMIVLTGGKAIRT